MTYSGSNHREAAGTVQPSNLQPITPECPSPVRHPVMLQSWLHLTFLHWPYDPAQVQPLLPTGLRIDMFDDSAWVGLVPFQICALRLPGTPSLPWISNFPETNVRTYAVGPDGSRGVWFFSLDAGRILAVIGARLGYSLPYFWADMRVARTGACVEYESRRKWPRPGSERARIVVEAGRRLRTEEIGGRDHFITARYRLFTVIAGKLGYAPIEHEQWPLAMAKVTELRESLVEAAGLLGPKSNPVVHYSERLDVRIGAPHLY